MVGSLQLHRLAVIGTHMVRLEEGMMRQEVGGSHQHRQSRRRHHQAKQKALLPGGHRLLHGLHVGLPAQSTLL